MSVWPEPAWLADITEESERVKAKARLHLSLAALYATPDGTFDGLAHQIGTNGGALRAQKWRGEPSPKTAIEIETLLGRAAFPRELLRPDLFLLPQE